MTRKEKKEELIGLFAVGAICIGDLIDECFEFGQHHPHWISVEDELPKENGRYLFYHDKIGVQLAYYYNDLSLDKAVTHWMPLPEAPKEGGKL